MIELKPCPFCGSEMIDTYKRNGRGPGWFVVCRFCGARGPLDKTATEAAKDWNKIYELKMESAALYGKNVRGE